MTARTYYDPNDMDSKPVFTKKGLQRPPAAMRAEMVLEHGLKRMSLPLDERSYSKVRGYIAGLKLPPSRLLWLATLLSYHAAGTATMPGRVVSPAGERIYRGVAFHCYRAALSLLIETAPRSYSDLYDLLPVLSVGSGALPASMRAKVAAVIGAQVADQIMGRPFKRRALVARRGGKRQ